MNKRAPLIITLITIGLIATVSYALFRAPAETTGPIKPVQIATIEPLEIAANDPAATPLPLYEIDPTSSLASFKINEVLNGRPVTAIGDTDQISAQIAFDATDLSTAKIGVIRINARTLVTDSNFRNRAIQNRILLTSLYEFIEFAPMALNGLPDSVAVGETVSFEIVGQLTLLETTKEVTFAATVNLDSAETISGTATAIVLRSEFDLQIPSVRSVASVEDEVTLELNFVANTQ